MRLYGCQSEHIHFLWRWYLVSEIMQQSFTPVKPDVQTTVSVNAATDVIAFVTVIRIGSTKIVKPGLHVTFFAPF